MAMMALIYSNIIEFTQAARIYSSNFTFWIFSTSKKIFNSCNMYIFLISAATPAATPATCYHQCLCAIDRSPTKGMQQGWEQQWFSMSWVWQEIYVWKKSQRAERVDSWKAENISAHLVLGYFIHLANIRLICWQIVERSHISATNVA